MREERALVPNGTEEQQCVFPRGNGEQIWCREMSLRHTGNGLPQNLLFCVFLYFERFGVYTVYRSIYWNLFRMLF